MCLTNYNNNKIMERQSQQSNIFGVNLLNYTKQIKSNSLPEDQQLVDRQNVIKSTHNDLHCKFKEKNQNINHQPQNKSKVNRFNSIQFSDLQPWTENDFEITEYHKIKQAQRKSRKNTNRSNISNISFLKKYASFSNRCSHRNNSQGNQKQSFKPYSTRYSSNNNVEENNFNTYTTSFQEQLKWRFQLQTMMKRKKKMSNLLKARHFGHLRSNTMQNEDLKKYIQLVDVDSNMQQSRVQSRKTLDYQGSMHKFDLKNQNNAKILKQIRKQQTIDLDNLYSALKTFTRKNFYKKSPNSRMKQQCRHANDKNQNYHDSNQRSSFSLKTQKNTINAKQNLHFRNRFSINMAPSSITSTRENSWHNNTLSKNKSISLTKTCYLGNSIKNKIKVMKSQNFGHHQRKQNSNAKSNGQITQQIPCITKLLAKTKKPIISGSKYQMKPSLNKK